MENPYQFDLTEIDGFDNLHEAEGIIKAVQEKAACIYHAQESHLLINGSSGGILAAVASCFERGDQVLVARNCHKSVYHAIELNGLQPVYLWPEISGEYDFFLGVPPKRVEQALDAYPHIKGLILTSPTYEGIVSDVSGIADIAHKKGILCIIDEAHGAHLGMHPYFPDSSAGIGDIVIQSLHKTLPALTQTGLLHVNGSRVSRAKLKKMLAVYQTSSPSYVLMSSIDMCLTWLLSEESKGAFCIYAGQLSLLRKRINKLKAVKIPELKGNDPSKLVLSVKGTAMSGTAFYHCLREKYKLQMEMVCGHNVLAMTSVCDCEEGYERLIKALEEIDAGLTMNGSRIREKDITGRESLFREEFSVPFIKPEEAGKLPASMLPLIKSEGYLAGDYVYQYPPGIPLLVPGERITRPLIQQMQQVIQTGQRLHGGYSPESGKILVLCK